MALSKARRALPAGARPDGPDGVVYRQQYVRCGKASCRKCPPHGPGHGPYWYGFSWHYRQRTKSFYVGKVLPAGVVETVETVETVEAVDPQEGTGMPPEPAVSALPAHGVHAVTSDTGGATGAAKAVRRTR